MVRVRVTMEGADPVIRDLRQTGSRLSGEEPLSPVMDIIAQDWASTMQEAIRNEELDLPPMHPVTRAIRRHYGHDTSPRLVRGGDLLHSIAPLSLEDRAFEVGSSHPYARLLHEGGQTVDPHGRTVELKPHPFVVVSDEMIDDAAQMVADYIFEAF